MITAKHIKHLLPQGETTTVQFKIRLEEAYKMGVEMVAFSNTQGGKLIVGVDDKTGAISGLSFEEIQQTNALLVNAASENVKPAIVIATETVSIDGQNIIVAAITKGKDKPYKDNKGIIWVKNGADKRKVFSNSELRVMMQSCGSLSADLDSVEGSSYKDVSESTLKNFLYERYAEECKKAGITNDTVLDRDIDEIVKAIDKNFTVEKLLRNLQLMDANGRLTLSGLLLLGKSIQRHRPVFTIKCVSFVGNTEAGSLFRDKMRDRDAEGNLLVQYNAAISFVTRNLKTVQMEKEFNTRGRLEIPLEVFVELLTNAFIHRDYYINSPIRLFIFDDRIEIHSPGILPDGVTEESIKRGISVPRNKLLFENAKDILPYTGIGSGIMRAMQNYDKILFNNDFVREEFITTIVRDDIPDEMIVHGGNEGANTGNEGINCENEGVNIEDERINDVNEGVPPRSEDVNEVNEGANLNIEGVKGKVERELESIYSYIKNNPLVKIGAIEQFSGKSNATVERYIKILKDNDLIEFVGAGKTGGYKTKQ
jgi:predicted HTH transcriptional regulator